MSTVIVRLDQKHTVQMYTDWRRHSTEHVLREKNRLRLDFDVLLPRECSVLCRHRFEFIDLCKSAQMCLRSTPTATVGRSYVVRSGVGGVLRITRNSPVAEQSLPLQCRHGRLFPDTNVFDAIPCASDAAVSRCRSRVRLWKMHWL